MPSTPAVAGSSRMGDTRRADAHLSMSRASWLSKIRGPGKGQSVLSADSESMFHPSGWRQELAHEMVLTMHSGIQICPKSIWSLARHKTLRWDQLFNVDNPKKISFWIPKRDGYLPVTHSVVFYNKKVSEKICSLSDTYLREIINWALMGKCVYPQDSWFWWVSGTS